MTQNERFKGVNQEQLILVRDIGDKNDHYTSIYIRTMFDYLIFIPRKIH